MRSENGRPVVKNGGWSHPEGSGRKSCAAALKTFAPKPGFISADLVGVFPYASPPVINCAPSHSGAYSGAPVGPESGGGGPGGRLRACRCGRLSFNSGGGFFEAAEDEDLLEFYRFSPTLFVQSSPAGRIWRVRGHHKKRERKEKTF